VGNGAIERRRHHLLKTDDDLCPLNPQPIDPVKDLSLGRIPAYFQIPPRFPVHGLLQHPARFFLPHVMLEAPGGAFDPAH